MKNFAPAAQNDYTGKSAISTKDGLPLGNAIFLGNKIFILKQKSTPPARRRRAFFVNFGTFRYSGGFSFGAGGGHGGGGGGWWLAGWGGLGGSLGGLAKP